MGKLGLKQGPVAPRICPSILAADFANLESELSRIANSDLVHVDVMDGHFVPNLTWGLPVVKRLIEVSPAPIDVHLMIDNPDQMAVRYAEAGAESVTFHLAATKAPIRLARAIRAAGSRAAVALKPATPIEPLRDFIDEFDMVLIMTVEPGFGGQNLIPGCLPKVAQTRQYIDETGEDIWLQVDGGITETNIAQAALAGADTFVAGSAVFRASSPAAEVEKLRLAAKAVPGRFS
jgi:ribulose-phosphate 3-epimerase